MARRVRPTGSGRLGTGRSPFRARWILAGVLAGVLVLAGGFLAYLAATGRLDSRPKPEPFGATWPGSAHANPLSPGPQATAAQGDIANRMDILLRQEGAYRAWHILAARDGSAPAMDSQELLLEDQLLAAQLDMELGRKADFLARIARIRDAFETGDGWYRSRLALGDAAAPEPGPDPATVSEGLLLARCLMEGYDRFREPDLRDMALDLADRLLARFPDGRMPAETEHRPQAPSPTPDLAASPTPRPTATPTPDPDRPLLHLVLLSDADLYALQLLSGLSSAWSDIYDTTLATVQDGFLGDDLPLFQEAYDPAAGGHVSYLADLPVLDGERAVRTLLHLCEVGEADPRSLAWLKEQLYNRRGIYRGYHIVTGQPATDAESIPALAMAARIARIQGDAALYAKAVERLLWHQATDPRSEALGALFRRTPENRIFLSARDNLWGLLAVAAP